MPARTELAAGTRPAKPKAHMSAAIAICGALTASVYMAAYRLPMLVELGALRNLVATGLAMPPLLLATYLVRMQADITRQQIGLIIAAMIAMRLAPPLGELIASDDAHRYLWDGLVQQNGLNPYLYPPNSKELFFLRDSKLFPNIFRPDMRTVYPPLAQLWFRVAHAIDGATFAGLKAVYLLHDLASFGFLLALLRRYTRSPFLVIVFAWSPLVITQTYADAHLDALMLPWMLVCLLTAERYPLLAGITLGGASMIRPIAMLAGPAIALRRPWRQTTSAALGFFFATGLLVLPFMSAGRGMVESIGVYSEHWRFNGSLFRLPDHFLHAHEHFRLYLYVVISLIAILIGFWRVTMPTKVSAGMGVYYACAPTVYPWYLQPFTAITLPCSTLFPLFLPFFSMLADTVFIAGNVGGDWSVPPWALVIEYAGLYGILGWEMLRARRHRYQATNGSSKAKPTA